MVTHTHIHTHTHDNYYNPRCAHAHRGLIIFTGFKIHYARIGNIYRAVDACSGVCSSKPSAKQGSLPMKNLKTIIMVSCYTVKTVVSKHCFYYAAISTAGTI